MQVFRVLINDGEFMHEFKSPITGLRRATSVSILATALGLICSGCEKPAATGIAPQPRAISVVIPDETSRAEEGLATGVAGAWKTEEIGFEVSGRVERVIEPDQDIEGEVNNPDDLDGQPLVVGTELARIASDRYRLAEKSARQRYEAKKIEVNQSIRERINAATAQQKLAQTSYDRMKGLAEQSAAARADLDEAEATWNQANANLAELEASLKSEKATLLSLEAELQQAQRDLADCVLVSSFRGQVARVHVFQGSFVQAGEPVVTVQMMDPIKVEVEVSAARSRTLKYRDIVPVALISNGAAGGSGPARATEPEWLDGFVYMTDTVADPQSRTFTVTLLVRNRKLRRPVPDRLVGETFARATDLWPVDFDFLPGADQVQTMVEERAIQRDEMGAFVWKIENRRVGESITDDNIVMNVRKVRIQPGNVRIPFLGNWMFVPFTFADDSEFDPETDMVVGNLTVDNGDASQFDGQFVLLDQPYWMVRPGDLVRVDLSGSAAPQGILIPVEAVVEKSGRKFVYAVEGDVGEKAEARQIEIKPLQSAREGTAVLVASGTLPPGTKIVAAGVHYIDDGETLLIHEIHRR